MVHAFVQWYKYNRCDKFNCEGSPQNLAGLLDRSIFLAWIHYEQTADGRSLVPSRIFYDQIIGKYRESNELLFWKDASNTIKSSYRWLQGDKKFSSIKLHFIHMAIKNIDNSMFN